MRYFKVEELKSILAAIPDVADRCMVTLTFWHGLRVSEVVGGWSVIKKEKVYHPPLTRENFRDGYLDVHRLKGSNHTTQRLLTHADPLLNERAMIEELLKTAKPGEPLFRMSRFAFRRLLKKAGKLAGVPEHKCTPHTLKHSTGKQFVKKLSINDLQQWMGHKNLSSTGWYTKSTDEEAGDAIAAVAGAI